jgi:hypothetical protein
MLSQPAAGAGGAPETGIVAAGRTAKEVAMRELVFALEFRGTAGPVPGSEHRMRAKTSASSQTLRSVIKADGIEAGVVGAAGDTATFESEVEVVGEGMFVESGTIRYGTGGAVHFKTVGRGILGPAPASGLQRGAVVWEVTGGEGKLRGAQGLITSNFTVGTAGEVVDDQFARLYLPS